MLYMNYELERINMNIRILKKQHIRKVQRIIASIEIESIKTTGYAMLDIEFPDDDINLYNSFEHLERCVSICDTINNISIDNNINDAIRQSMLISTIIDNDIKSILPAGEEYIKRNGIIVRQDTFNTIKVLKDYKYERLGRGGDRVFNMIFDCIIIAHNNKPNGPIKNHTDLNKGDPRNVIWYAYEKFRREAGISE